MRTSYYNKCRLETAGKIPLRLFYSSFDYMLYYKFNYLSFKTFSFPTLNKKESYCHLSLFRDNHLSIKRISVIISSDNKSDNKIFEVSIVTSSLPTSSMPTDLYNLNVLFFFVLSVHKTIYHSTY